jgi:hypothetical protein
LTGFSAVAGLLLLGEFPALSVCLFAGSALIAVGYFRNGTVWIAFRALKSGRSDRAERLIAKTRNPSWLSAGQRAYYELLKGTLAGEKGDLSAAETHLRAALSGRLRTRNDIQVAKLALADVVLHRGELRSAEALLAEVRAEPTKEGLKPYIEEIEERVRSAPRSFPNP